MNRTDKPTSDRVHAIIAKISCVAFRFTCYNDR